MAEQTSQPQPIVRPGVATTFGVLNCVCGGLGLFSLSNLFQINADPMGLYQLLGDDFKYWSILSTILGVLASIWLLCCGIGLLNLKSWGRSGSVIYGMYGILMSVVSAVMIFWTASEIDQGPLIIKGGFYVGLIFGLLFGLAYSILLLVFMNRPKMREVYG